MQDNPAYRLDGYSTKREQAKKLGRSERTLDRWHELRIGPPRIKVAGLILYKDSDTQAWLDANREVA